MADLTLSSDWVTGVYRIETSDQVIGGEDGIDNIQAKQLGARTNFLKGVTESQADQIADLQAADAITAGAIVDIQGDIQALMRDAERVLGAATGMRQCVVAGQHGAGSLSSEPTFGEMLAGTFTLSADVTQPLVASLSGGYDGSGPINYYYYTDIDHVISVAGGDKLLLLKRDSGTGIIDLVIEEYVTPEVSYIEPTVATNGKYWYNLSREEMYHREAGEWVPVVALIIGMLVPGDDVIVYYPTYRKTPMQLYGVSHVPSGTVTAFAGVVGNIPIGYLLCNGGAISRTAYSYLYRAIGTTYGTGDGTTTFNLPDLRGEFLRGLDNARGVDTSRVLGSAQVDDLKSHTHSYSRSGTSSAGGTAGVIDFVGFLPSSGITGSTGGTETRPRNIAMHYIIKF